jgi:glyoxylase-like metal-dependent hydrolase (beta-lactamase superfamily II)
MKTTFICQTCGTQFSESTQSPENCPICDDERQYVPESGQRWLTYTELQSNYSNTIQLEEPHLYGIGVTPKVGIGQRALLVQTGEGNVLWDCVPLIDATTVKLISDMGGLTAIAISHPHFYTSMVEWSQAFDNVPIYLHASDRTWVSRPSENIQFWTGSQQELLPGVTIINCGGHFPGSSVLHWQHGAEGRGVLLTGDTLMVVPDRRYVSFMYSFPNLVPLPPQSIRQIVDRLADFQYDRIYSGWFGSVLSSNAKENVTYSADRYISSVTAS